MGHVEGAHGQIGFQYQIIFLEKRKTMVRVKGSHLYANYSSNPT